MTPMIRRRQHQSFASFCYLLLILLRHYCLPFSPTCLPACRVPPSPKKCGTQHHQRHLYASRHPKYGYGSSTTPDDHQLQMNNNEELQDEVAEKEDIKTKGETKSSNNSTEDTITPEIEAKVTSVEDETTNSTGGLAVMNDRKINLMWCDFESCTDVLRERVVGDHNQIIINGPATGQVAYQWSRNIDVNTDGRSPVTHASVLLLVKPQDESLIEKAAEAVPQMTHCGIEVLLFAELAAKLKYNYGVDDERIKLFEPPKEPKSKKRDKHVDDPEECWIENITFHQFPDLICTLGGDGLLMFASNLFQGAVPPIISIAGGSLGFLTPFSVNEICDALQTALGIGKSSRLAESSKKSDGLGVFPPNMEYPFYDPAQASAPHLVNGSGPKFLFGMGDLICMTIRMRLDCRIVNPEGIVRERYSVLNELVIDRGSSPYLSALECYCDDQHLTTVQADGIIFATPTGSTAYSMSAGGSVVHPAVPCILVTPICPHVLSFRSMVFPDHVVLRCYVPDDARSGASVAFDGKHRQEIQRGDSVQIQMSSYPVPTINRGDNSADWLDSLKRSFNFNTRPRQRPL